KHTTIPPVRRQEPARHNWHPLLVAILAWLLLTASCSQNRQSGKKIFRYNEYAGIASLDPAFAKNQSTMWPAHQLFNTLVEIDDSLLIRPSLATRWEI